MSDGFEGYDAYKLQSPEDEHWRARRPLCRSCGEACDGLLCEDCDDEREGGVMDEQEVRAIGKATGEVVASLLESWIHAKLADMEEQRDRARCDAKDAQQMLVDERARFESSLSELRSSATEQTVSLVPGSVPAVIEAYRLLVGDSLKWSRQFGWHDYTECDNKRLSEATLQLIHWLDVYAPGGKP